jgi:hypothetical protein
VSGLSQDARPTFAKGSSQMKLLVNTWVRSKSERPRSPRHIAAVGGRAGR